LWSFYVDLEESIGSVESTKAVYDKILDLRIANAQIIVNYAAFLEENQYFEESFKVLVSLTFHKNTDMVTQFKKGV
jgi:pre-mRNA-splicing factor SYF1